MLSLYRIPIIYMIFYTIVILGTGVWLFLLSQGLANSQSIVHTLQEIILAPKEKSMHNFIEVATPHLFAMGTLVFVVAHFMLFSTKISQKFSLIISMLLFVFMLINIFSYTGIIFGVMVSGIIKLLTMSMFVGLFLVLLSMVFVS